MQQKKLIAVLKTLPPGKMRDRALHAAATAALARMPRERVEDAVSEVHRSQLYPHLVSLAWEASLHR